MIKKNNTLGVSLLALLAAAVLSPPSASAADIGATGCTLQGAISGGGLLGWQSYDADSDGGGDELNDTDWSALFAEAAGIVSCDAWNFQADYAYYGHSADLGEKDDELESKSLESEAGSHHFGGAVFWRDPQFAAFGLSGSYINQDADWWILDKDNDYYRAGLFGEFYASDRFTLGGSAHYFTGSSDLFGKDFADHSGFELAAIAKFYATPELAFTLRGDYMISEFSEEFEDGGGSDVGFDGYAVTGEAEYLVWDEGLSLFGGARFASREFDDEFGIGFDDLQVYAGIKFAFGGGGGGLVDRDRSGSYDNTSVMLEKLPNAWASFGAAVSSDIAR
jgi:hypothetical protein